MYKVYHLEWMWIDDKHLYGMLLDVYKRYSENLCGILLAVYSDIVGSLLVHYWEFVWVVIKFSFMTLLTVYVGYYWVFICDINEISFECIIMLICSVCTIGSQ